MYDLVNGWFEDGVNLKVQGIQMTDSDDEICTIRIIPIDTFSFSAQHGFKGKAEKIELSGKLRRVISRTDSAGLLEEKQRVVNNEEEYESKKVEVSKLRVLEKRAGVW